MLEDETSDGMIRCNRRLGEVLTACIASAKSAMLRTWIPPSSPTIDLVNHC